VCSTLGELEQRVESSDSSRPIFFYSLPQNVHIAVASRRKVPAGESYPGFFPAVASSIRRIDGCFGSFIDFLKRTNRYDNSIVILTADHGDSLGEEGRWGHAFFIVPEVMRIPLIVHVPPRLRERMPVDLSALTFSSDIVPSLYALLGYEPGVPGSLAGRAAFGPSADDSAWRRRDEFLLASSYGAVYAVLRRNGTRMYVVDAVDGSDSAFDLSDDGIGQRLPVTETVSKESRARIRLHLAVLARENRYRPRS
jgi:arylsulfatase A-like enzyme